MRFVWVGVAGAIGSVLRYLVGLSFGTSHAPWGTLWVNLLGSFALGLLLSWGVGLLPASVTTPIAVGLLGGFTTFSAFVWEAATMAGGGRALHAAGYVTASVLGGLLAAVLGRAAGDLLH